MPTPMPSEPAPRRLPLRAAVASLMCGLVLSTAAQGTGDKLERAGGGGPQAGLERAQRLAGNPLRAILEAGRMKRRPGETVVSESAAVAVVVPQLLTLAAFGEPVAGLDNARQPLAHLPEAAPARPLPPLPAVSEPVTQAQPATRSPQLLRRVEPLFSPELASQLAGVDKVTAVLTLRPDGSVADAVLQEPLDRQLHSVVLRTLLQWQYDTAPAERVHRVELVFNAGR